MSIWATSRDARSLRREFPRLGGVGKLGVGLVWRGVVWPLWRGVVGGCRVPLDGVADAGLLAMALVTLPTWFPPASCRGGELLAEPGVAARRPWPVNVVPGVLGGRAEALAAGVLGVVLRAPGMLFRASGTAPGRSFFPPP